MLFNLKNKQILHNFYLQIKKSYSISFLPPKVETFYNTPLMRIFRVIGGISIGLVITGKYALLAIELHTIVFIFATIHSIIFSIIASIKFFYGLYLVIKKPEVFEVKNSPLNPFASHLARILYCAKLGCQGAVAVTGMLAAAVTYDTILEASGRPKVFVPAIAKIFNQVFGEPMLPQHHDNLKELAKNNAPDSSIPDYDKEWDSLSLEEKKNLIEDFKKSNVN